MHSSPELCQWTPEDKTGCSFGVTSDIIVFFFGVAPSNERDCRNNNASSSGHLDDSVS